MPIFVGPRDREDLLRMIQASREAEKLNRNELDIPTPGVGSPAVRNSVEIEVTGSKITSTDPPYTLSPGEDFHPDDQGVSQADYYPGKFVYYNPLHSAPENTWNELADDQGDCLVIDVNGEDLENGRRYIGEVIGLRNQKPVVLVATSSGGSSGGDLSFGSDFASGSGTGPIAKDVWNTLHSAISGDLKITIPSQGNYLLMAQFFGTLQSSAALVGTEVAYMLGAIATDAGSRVQSVLISRMDPGDSFKYGNASIYHFLTNASEASVYKLQGFCTIYNATTTTVSTNMSGFSIPTSTGTPNLVERTRLSYVKLGF